VGTPAYWYWRWHGEKPLRLGSHTVPIRISSYLGDYREVRFFEEHETEEMADILTELSADDVFLDVGANIGIHSLFAAQVADDVYAIEPHPVNASYLLINSGRNRADVAVYSCALSDESTYVGLSGPRGGLLADGSAALSHHELPSKQGGGDPSNEIFVRTERGDDLIEDRGLRLPTVVKIDVEGEEERVIDGLSETLTDERCRVVYCEVHEDRADYDSIVSTLEEAGFSIAVVDERDYSTTIKATK
jgi:FkbM family methyltransferase